MKRTFLFFGILLGLSLSAQSWNVTGNSGTDPLINFIGTTDDKDFVLKTNNFEAMRILNNGNIYISSQAAKGIVPIDKSFRFINTGSSVFYVSSNSSNYFLMQDLRTSKNLLRIATSNNSDSSIFMQENGGNVIIGSSNNLSTCTSCAGYKLFVKDGIKTEKIKVEFANANGWADYVFENDYKLMPLEDLKSFVLKNKHLPEIPTAKDVVENGLELKEFNALLLKKVEELTLHVIQLNESLQKQNEKIKFLENNQNQKL